MSIKTKKKKKSLYEHKIKQNGYTWVNVVASRSTVVNAIGQPSSMLNIYFFHFIFNILAVYQVITLILTFKQFFTAFLFSYNVIGGLM